MSLDRTIMCAFCSIRRSWPDGFPSSTYAECWVCFWERHQREAHVEAPKRKRWWRL